jgi:hypothetical protein
MGFNCLKKCAICCGTFPFNKEWAQKHKEAFQVEPEETREFEDQVIIITEDFKCIFLDRKTKQCSVYNDRPKLCRRYGTDDEVPCPFLNPDGSHRNRMERMKADMQIQQTIDVAINFLDKAISPII